MRFFFFLRKNVVVLAEVLVIGFFLLFEVLFSPFLSFLLARGNLILQSSSLTNPRFSSRHSTVFRREREFHLAKKDAKATQLGDTPTLGLYKGRESSEDDLWSFCSESNASPERLVR